MHGQHLLEKAPHGQARIERGIRILKDHLELPAERAQCATAEMSDLAPREEDRSACGRQKPQDRFAERRFPAARFADQAQSLAGIYEEIDVVDGAQRAGAELKMHGEMVDGEQRQRHAAVSSATRKQAAA